MSDHMSLDQARTIATGYGAYMVNEVRAARTIVAQAEQVERLQAALREVEDWGMDILEPLTGVGILREGDMEAPQ